jgi:hypothetical protein
MVPGITRLFKAYNVSIVLRLTGGLIHRRMDLGRGRRGHLWAA